MTAAGDQGTGDRADPARAEAYLRLLAETELRRALAFPPVEPPVPGHRHPFVIAALRAGRPVAAGVATATRPLAPSARRARLALQPWAARARRTFAPSARRAGQARSPMGWRAVIAAHRVRRRLSAAHRVRRRRSGRAGFQPPGAEARLRRVWVVAAALTAAGALDSATADSVADTLEAALAARSRIDRRRLHPGHPALALRRRPHTPAAPPSGPLQAIGVGTTVTVEAGGQRAEVNLMTLVLAPDRAALTMTARLPGQSRRPRLAGPPHHDLVGQLNGARGTDDRGAPYGLGVLGGGDDQSWDGTYEISPVPAAGIRWLEVSLVPGGSAIRIDVPATAARCPAETRPLPAASPAERFLGTAAENLLRLGTPAAAAEHELAWLPDVVAALQAAGTLPPGSQALARLVTLARRLGIRVPAELADTPDVGLPEPWVSVLSRRNCGDGPVGVSPAAAVLPELDGVRCVLAGLTSRQRSATLHVLAWGWQPPRTRFRGAAQQSFSWWARDDTGRWHIADENGSSSHSGHAEFQLELTPPLHPRATSLQVILTGRSGSVAVGVPLDWTATVPPDGSAGP
jgi:hypothetical protein